jgi:hypothetical protein
VFSSVRGQTPWVLCWCFFCFSKLHRSVWNHFLLNHLLSFSLFNSPHFSGTMLYIWKVKFKKIEKLENPVLLILATQETDTGRITVHGHTGQKGLKTPSEPIKSWMWWCLPVIPAVPEGWIGG